MPTRSEEETMQSEFGTKDWHNYKTVFVSILWFTEQSQKSSSVEFNFVFKWFHANAQFNSIDLFKQYSMLKSRIQSIE